ncbi:MAG: GspH/FimT family pseudopilin [Betaproteobacteria bacterium]|nr:GspH/FimT family pseudopilin [Betaproteobacteria bacterium]
MLIVIAVVSILAVMAAPSFSTLISSTRSREATMDLQTALWLARSEAVKRNQAVVVARAGGGSWTNGWTVTGPGSVILANHDALSGTKVTTSVPDITYLASGRVSGDLSVALSISGELPGSKAYCLRVAPSGRPFVKDGPC